MFMLYRYIHVLVQRSQHVLKKGVVWIWPFLLTQHLSISIRLDRRSICVRTMLWDYVLVQLHVFHVATRFLSTFPGHPSRFYYTLGTLPSRPPRLYHALTVSSVRYRHLHWVLTALSTRPTFQNCQMNYCPMYAFAILLI